MSPSARKRPLSLDRSVTPPPKRKPRVPDENDHSDHVDSNTTPPISKDVFKVVSWNVNSVQPFLQTRISFSANPAPKQSLRWMLKRQGWPSLLCLQEVKIASSDASSQRRLQQAANEKALPAEPLYDAVFSLPRDKYNATGFGGKVHGVATLFRKELGSTFKTRIPDWDLEGRILIHDFQAGLVVVNGYWVNGTEHPYRSSTTGEIAGTRHDLKLRYHRDILQEVLKCEKRGESVVLVGDMNVARARIDGHPNLRVSPNQHVKNRQDFNDKFFDSHDGMKGIDVFRHLHGNAKKFTWHATNRPHGTVCDRVDYIIGSRALLDEPSAIVESDICDNAEDKMRSDHVPVWIAIDFSKIRHRPSPARAAITLPRSTGPQMPTFQET